ncbi:hypothetical protein OESDEN_01361 [Oesophagostomum dentatum]|uniref:Insulin-like domain-containing protein n=1 Tax=Oesophagostomum dentatum TaxID=61180 RepID=A0A0B1TN71_OESDE|nr:hypothetical protein OESDEN_01361 [Oesophagostomum dentatum]
MCGKRLSAIMDKMCTRAGESTPCYGSPSEYGDGEVDGIAERCCIHRCAYDQLYQYCCSKEEADSFYEMLHGKYNRRRRGAEPRDNH